MKKNFIKLIPNKKLVYEENYSIDQVDFNSQFTPKNQKTHQSFTLNTLRHFHYSKKIIKNLMKHNAISEKDINGLMINKLILKKKSHVNAHYNDVIIASNNANVLRRYYTINESLNRLPKFSIYYKHYLTLLVKPTISSQLYNTIMHNSSNQKAQLYWFQAYGCKSRESTLSNNDNNNEIQNAIFDSETKESIDHFSTTITCESNEQLRYPEEMLRRIIEKQFINSVPLQYDKTITLSETHFNLNKSERFLNEESIIHLMNNFRKPNNARRPKHFLTTSGVVKFDYMVRTKRPSLKTSSLLTENKEKTLTQKVSINYQTINSKQKTKNNPLLNSDKGPQLRMRKTSYYTNINKNTNQFKSMISNYNKTIYTSKYKQRRLSGIDSKSEITLKSTEIKSITHRKAPKELLFSAEKFEKPKGRKTFISRSKSPMKAIGNPKQFINTNSFSSSHHFMSHNSIQGCYKDIYNKRREHFLHNKYY